MQVLLAENIRNMRRGRHLTQEQLAEVLGVAVGTVSKWESGSTTPDLALVMELADFFGTSVDVLLGYRQQSASLAGTLERLRTLRDARQYGEGRRAAEKAVRQYPNSFDVAYQGAALYDMAALESGDHAAARRAGELYARALELMEQNTDPKISRIGIGNRLANLALQLGETGRGLALLKQNNVEGVNDALLGQTLAKLPEHRAEAPEYLENALIGLLPRLFSLCMGYLNLAGAGRFDAADARALTLLAIQFLDGLRRPGAGSALDKYLAALWCACAMMSEQREDTAQAGADLRQAYLLAQRYDAAPTGTVALRFVRPARLDEATAFDDFGSTARSGVEEVLRENGAEYPRLCSLWEGFCHENG